MLFFPGKAVIVPMPQFSYTRLDMKKEEIPVTVLLEQFSAFLVSDQSGEDFPPPSIGSAPPASVQTPTLSAQPATNTETREHKVQGHNRVKMNER